MSWDYVELSHMAKSAGGPELFIKTLEEFNYQEGVKAGMESRDPYIAVAFGGGVLFTGFIWLCQHIRKSRKKSELTEAEATEARMRLMEEMRTSDNNERRSEESEEP